MKALICAEVYSANLGDGVIADCLTHALLSGPFASEVCYFDLAGRSGYSSLGIRGTAIRASRRHSIAFDAARVAKVVARRWMPDGRSWASNLRRSIKASDALLIGGGQLHIDNYLEFPVRISDVVKAARAQSKNVVFAFCGVGARWGRVASRLFEQSLCDDRVKLIATRDARSAERLQHRIPGVSTKTIAVADPGVLADEVYTRSEKQFDLGLGV